MKRINPNDVVDAFRLTGITPLAGNWGIYDDTNGGVQKCGCALTAIAVNEGHSFDDLLRLDDSVGMYEYLEEHLSIDQDYALGFVNGFDNIPMAQTAIYLLKNEKWERFMAGYSDGRESRTLLERFSPVREDSIPEY